MKTRTAPWDYKKRYQAPAADRFTTCPECGYVLAVRSGQDIFCYRCHVVTIPVRDMFDDLTDDQLAALYQCIKAVEYPQHADICLGAAERLFTFTHQQARDD
jgi:hypothetical protein